MKWMDEMFAGMESDGAADSVKRDARKTKIEPSGHLEKETCGATEVWSTLFSTITADVAEFNRHAKRVGQAPVLMSQRQHQCEVYLPGMHSKKLVLSLENNDLHVCVHPEFPDQQATITIEPDADGKHGFWVLSGHTAQRAKLSAEQLSEYLLKPILSSASINREL
jgi:hypothetical protein